MTEPIHITVSNRSGSVEHYYHFLLGLCVPIVEASVDLGIITARKAVRECGPLSPLLHDLGLNIETIRRDTSTMLPTHLHLYGYDSQRHYASRPFSMFRNHVLAAEREIVGDESPNVLVIERGVPHPFYMSDLAERPGSGTTRRSIRNHAELVDCLGRYHANVVNVLLEDIPLGEQAALFSAARVIVAQHGAALANLIFCRPGIQVIEIGLGRNDDDHFRSLANVIGLRYTLCPQESNHPIVNPMDVLKLIKDT